MPNIYEPEFDMERDQPPYVWRRSRISRQAGSERLGASLFDVPPGGETFPLHVHLHNEELLVVVAGTPTLRTLEGERTLAAGEVVAFPAGHAGAHALRNDTNEIWVRDYVPGSDMPEGAYDVRTRLDGD
jgi:uncharacterized cupin superfamily protein